jgi:hypothetical protein
MGLKRRRTMSLGVLAVKAVTRRETEHDGKDQDGRALPGSQRIVQFQQESFHNKASLMAKS